MSDGKMFEFEGRVQYIVVAVLYIFAQITCVKLHYSHALIFVIQPCALEPKPMSTNYHPNNQ